MNKPLSTYTALSRAIDLSEAALALIQPNDTEQEAGRKLQAAGAEIGIKWDFPDGRPGVCAITTFHQIEL